MFQNCKIEIFLNKKKRNKLKNSIELMENNENKENVKTMIDLGENFFVKAKM
jgi:prefoldin subunit 5